MNNENIDKTILSRIVPCLNALDKYYNIIIIIIQLNTKDAHSKSDK